MSEPERQRRASLCPSLALRRGQSRAHRGGKIVNLPFEHATHRVETGCNLAVWNVSLDSSNVSEPHTRDSRFARVRFGRTAVNLFRTELWRDVGIILRGVGQVEERFHGGREQVPAGLADALGGDSEIEKGDHGRRTFLAATTAHRVIMVVREEPQPAAPTMTLAAFRTACLAHLCRHSNCIAFHRTAPIVTFGPSYSEFTSVPVNDRHSSVVNHAYMRQN